MSGAVDLRQLAHLLRVGSELARELALLRNADTEEILTLVDQASGIADRLDEIAMRQQSADGIVV